MEPIQTMLHFPLVKSIHRHQKNKIIQGKQTILNKVQKAIANDV
jgi:hypothetical protein